jgi:hypothetical protein
LKQFLANLRVESFARVKVFHVHLDHLSGIDECDEVIVVTFLIDSASFVDTFVLHDHAIAIKINYFAEILDSEASSDEN